MRYSLFLLCFILNGCWYSNGCFYTPQMVNCYMDKVPFSSIAYYQKIDSIGHTDINHRWRDAELCGAKYGDQELYYINKTGKYEEFQSCMERKGYKRFWPAECGYKNSKWDKGICNE